MEIAIIKYNAGNIFSVDYALKRLGITPIITADKDEIRKADKVIFPGVGEAKHTMDYLKSQNLDQLICDLQQPVLGICLGMQLLCRHSDEGNVNCLGVFDTDVLRFQPTREREKIPHMGWNTLSNLHNPLFSGVTPDEYVYFVHSFYVPVNQFTAAETNYIHPFSAALHKDNFYATQFHPEKSGLTGEKILRNFIEI